MELVRVNAFEFNESAAVVTGGGSGIGRSMVLEIASRGASIVDAAYSTYGKAAKSAVDGLSDVLRAEFEDHDDDFGITVLHRGRCRRTSVRPAVHPQGAHGEDLSDATSYVHVRQQVGVEREPKGPEWVGWQVSDAILHNDPYCLTHPSAETDLEVRKRDWIRGDRGRSRATRHRIDRRWHQDVQGTTSSVETGE
jgi:hypothetical protein